MAALGWVHLVVRRLLRREVSARSLSRFGGSPRVPRGGIAAFTGGFMHDDDTQQRNTMFARSGTNSALRAATRNNPRVHPCPRCKQPNRLTPADVRQGYQCDACADAEEGCC